MKVAFISTYDVSGGAAQSSWRTANALLAAGVDVKVIVQQRRSAHPIVVDANPSFFKKKKAFFNEWYERLLFASKESSPRVRFKFSLAHIGQDISDIPAVREADILHLHWIHKGFLSLENLKQLDQLGKPVIWQLHDMWAFTGGCHYAGPCTYYETACRNCWHLKQAGPNDLSNRIWNAKDRLYKSLDWTFVASSAWLAGLAGSSSLLSGHKVMDIPTPVESDIFRPFPKKDLREKLNLPQDKKLLLFVAMNVADDRKGFNYLLEGIKSLKINHPGLTENLELAVFGKAKNDVLDNLPLKVHYLGFLSSREAIAEAYGASDVFVMPSLEDNLPNTILEALACGLPVVAFETGGIPEMVVHNKTGYIARYKDADDLAEGIRWTLADPERTVSLSQNSRKRALQDYSFDAVAQRYIALYNALLENR